jgi:hypothetical protein
MNRSHRDSAKARVPGRHGVTTRRGATLTALATSLVAAGVMPGSASAFAAGSAWVPVAPVESQTYNPCTDDVVGLHLFDVSLLVTGHGGAHQGFKFAGQFETSDGFSGTFRDQDQANVVPDAETDNVFTQLVIFNGANEDKQRVRFTSVLHVVIRDDAPVNIVEMTSARCVGKPA